MLWITIKQQAYLCYIGIGIINRVNSGSPFGKAMFDQRSEGGKGVRHTDM